MNQLELAVREKHLGLGCSVRK